MYIRSKKNNSGSVSIQIIEKKKGKYIVLKSLGIAKNEKEENILRTKAKQYIKDKEPQQILPFSSNEELTIENYLKNINNAPVISNIGPELILGKIFNQIGLNIFKDNLFKHIVLARLTYPISKLKTTEYLLQHHNIDIDVDKIYRFLDKFHKHHKIKIEEIVFKHSKKILGEINMVFYDMTTLYFETEDEDDLRKIGFSKDGKFQCPQIMLGLLVGKEGYPIAYDIYEGNTFEGHTMISIIEQTQKRFKLPKPTIIADSGLLSKDNLNNLEKLDYDFILGARIKNETNIIKNKIIEKTRGLKNKKSVEIKKQNGLRLIISYSDSRAKKDKYNREKGIKKLQERIKSGKLNKESINNRGYNKFLVLNNEISVDLDIDKIKQDELFDGLKGYITNHKDLEKEKIIANYNNLWKIEKAFRISKTDLRIRPIYHRKKERIEAHICIAFCAYAIYKELERQLILNNVDISSAKAIELSKTIFEIEYFLPEQKKYIKVFNNLSNLQKILLNI